MTKLEFVNKFFFQWFFVRLTRCQSKIYLDFKGGDDWMAQCFPKGRQETGSAMQWYSIQGFIVPITGWSTEFKFIGKRWFLQITKRKMVRA